MFEINKIEIKNIQSVKCFLNKIPELNELDYEIMMRLEEEEIISHKVDGEDRRVLMSIKEFEERWN